MILGSVPSSSIKDNADATPDAPPNQSLSKVDRELGDYYRGTLLAYVSRCRNSAYAGRIEGLN